MKDEQYIGERRLFVSSHPDEPPASRVWAVMKDGTAAEMFQDSESQEWVLRPSDERRVIVAIRTETPITEAWTSSEPVTWEE